MSGGTGAGQPGGARGVVSPHENGPEEPDGPDDPRGGHGSEPAVPAAERGATRIADRVVAKIAAQAAREAVGPLPEAAARPHATVVVRPHAQGPGEAPADAAHIRLHLELGYPADIAGHCRAVRRHVTERVGALVGMEVPEVAVEVERLHLPTAYGAQGRTR
ncbi:Asp23/Gls24 family envelope stress response protein [Streptomyces sp. NPDC059477]|uniref:Asp23/Gls24 family envelope stress response protein n=1 Tax=Streptomyces sp. NPDC059477 TaxID=3346847 RepID=UPI0036BEED7E